MFFFSMCVGLVIQDFDQIRAYNNHETAWKVFKQNSKGSTRTKQNIQDHMNQLV